MRASSDIRSLIPPLMRCAAIALMLVMAAGLARAQVGFDRPGSDYSTFILRSGDPAACAARCDREGRCRAWSFSYPGAAGPRAVCSLKGSVPARVESACCVSGVRGGGVVEPRTNATEYGIDRFGADYRNFETPADADGGACSAACRADPRCRAWTHLRAGYGTATARCYLKSRITPPRRKPCCISGVVR